jgi:DNA-binding Lrp family transcriptional regulator
LTKRALKRLKLLSQDGREPLERSRPLDDTDRRILRIVQDNARITSAELARRVDLSGAGLQKRLRKLEHSGVIKKYVTLLNRHAVGYGLLCFVQVTLAHHEPESVGRFRKKVREFPEVLECHYLTGEFDYLLKVVVRDHHHLEELLFEGLTRVPGVDRIRTSIVLREIKDAAALPV